MTAPIVFFWDGDQMVPLLRHKSLCDKQFVVGEQYKLVPQEDRSVASHRHYFAAIAEGWRNLPEHLAEQFPSETHLRKYALIRAGYADKRSIVCASKAEAQRVAAFVKPMDEFALVTVSETVVTVYTAQSQSLRAMGRKAFQASKESVLDVIAGMVGVPPATLRQEAGRAA